MTEPQVLVDDILPGVKKDFWWHPHSRAIHDAARGFSELYFASGLKKRIEGVINLVKVFPRTWQS
jgi:succinate-semialdehyde dehydrogenase/glutarate-semialdehyde dehydrogenase